MNILQQIKDSQPIRVSYNQKYWEPWYNMVELPNVTLFIEVDFTGETEHKPCGTVGGYFTEKTVEVETLHPNVTDVEAMDEDGEEIPLTVEDKKAIIEALNQKVYHEN